MEHRETVSRLGRNNGPRWALGSDGQGRRRLYHKAWATKYPGSTYYGRCPPLRSMPVGSVMRVSKNNSTSRDDMPCYWYKWLQRRGGKATQYDRLRLLHDGRLGRDVCIVQWTTAGETLLAERLAGKTD